MYHEGSVVTTAFLALSLSLQLRRGKPPMCTLRNSLFLTQRWTPEREGFCLLAAFLHRSLCCSPATVLVQ